MNGSRSLAIVLIVGGVLACMYGGFDYSKNLNTVDLGVATVKVEKTERVNIPLWLGVVAIAGGTALLVSGYRRG